MRFFNLYCVENCNFVRSFGSLRCAEPDDAEQIYRWENDRSVWRVSGTFVPYTRFQIEQFLLNNNDLFSQKQLRLMIDLTENGTTIGCLDLYDFDSINEHVSIGILIDAVHRNQGHAQSALFLCLDYLFHDLKLHQAFCVIDELNTESRHLFEKQGFVPCGRRKEWIKTNDGFVDLVEYQLINAKP